MPATELQFSVEQLNFFKFESIVRDDFPEAMRLVFKTLWDKKFPTQPWDDSDALRNQLSTQEAGNPKKHMIPTGTSYKTWDCTALVQATIFAFSFKDPATSQKLNDKYLKRSAPLRGSLRLEVIPTGNQDETFALAVDQLRLLRNEFSHLSTSKVIDKTKFYYCIYHAKKAFQAVGYSTKNIDDISEMPEDEFPTKNTAKLKKIIKEKLSDKRIFWCFAGLTFVLLVVILVLILSLPGYDIQPVFKSPGPSGKTITCTRKS